MEHTIDEDMMDLLSGKKNEFRKYAGVSTVGKASLEKMLIKEILERELNRYGLTRKTAVV